MINKQEVILTALLLGGPGSGNFGHAGRPGAVGGSGSGSGGVGGEDKKSETSGSGYRPVGLGTNQAQKVKGILDNEERSKQLFVLGIGKNLNTDSLSDDVFRSAQGNQREIAVAFDIDRENLYFADANLDDVSHDHLFADWPVSGNPDLEAVRGVLTIGKTEGGMITWYNTKDEARYVAESVNKDVMEVKSIIHGNLEQAKNSTFYVNGSKVTSKTMSVRQALYTDTCSSEGQMSVMLSSRCSRLRRPDGLVR